MTDTDDVRALVNLVNLVFTAADARDWDTYRSLLNDEVRLDFAGVGPHQPGPASADDVAGRTRAALEPVWLTQHQLTNHVVEVDGDRARVSFHEQALHHHPALGASPEANTWTLFARGTRDAVRTDQGWRISGTGLIVTHQTGNTGLLTAAARIPRPSPFLPCPATDVEEITVPQPIVATDVLSVVHQYFTAADARDWTTYRALHADRVTVDFGGINDNAQGAVNADDMLRSARDLLDPVQLTQHMISSDVVHIDGDEAVVSFYEHALHHHAALGPDPAVNTWTLYGRGTHRLRRTPEGWKIVAATLTPVHQTGNPDLLAAVAASSR